MGFLKSILSDSMSRVSLFLMLTPFLWAGGSFLWGDYIAPHRPPQGLMLTYDGDFIDEAASKMAAAQGGVFWQHQLGEIEDRLQNPGKYGLDVAVLTKSYNEILEMREQSKTRNLIYREEKKRIMREHGLGERLESPSYKTEEEIENLEEKMAAQELEELYSRLILKARSDYELLANLRDWVKTQLP